MPILGSSAPKGQTQKGRKAKMAEVLARRNYWHLLHGLVKSYLFEEHGEMNRLSDHLPGVFKEAIPPAQEGSLAC